MLTGMELKTNNHRVTPKNNRQILKKVHLAAATFLLLPAFLLMRMLDQAGLFGPNTYLDLDPQKDVSIDVINIFPKPNKSISDLSGNTIQGEKNIFFVESWQPPDHMMHLVPRGACAIEAAAKQNPDYQIYVFFLDVTGYTEEAQSLVTALEWYDNVHLIGVSLMELAQNSSITSWVKEGAYKSSRYKIGHVADIARLLILSKFVGTYMDYDMWSLKGISHLGVNYAVAESVMLVTNNFMNFGSDTTARQLINRLLDLLPDVWKPNGWTTQGPGLITQVLREQCNTVWTDAMTRENCGGFQVIPSKEVLPISLYERDYFFETGALKKGVALLNNATAIHLWSSYTRHRLVDKNAKILLNYIATQVCPRTFQSIEIEW